VHAASVLDTHRPGIAGVAYDTAWLAGVPARHDRRQSRFPTSLRWLTDHQLPDGSWGSRVRYEHDRILCTLAALAPLAQFGRRDEDRIAVEAGTRYLWQHGHLLRHEPVEMVGFELLLPTLIQRARLAGVNVPPHLDVYTAERARKLELIPAEALYSPHATVVHSLEFLGDQVDLQRLRAAQGANGAIGNSPAATAFFLSQAEEPRAQRYLEHCLEWTDSATAPVLHPCETFELLWAAYHLFLAGVPAQRLLSPAERQHLKHALAEGGVSLSPTFPIPDADDTAVALLLMQQLGEAVDPGVLRAFEARDGTFVSFPYERHSSVGVNVHVLHALARVPGYPEAEARIRKIVEYLVDEHSGLYWIDKWHISPLYATSHVVRVAEHLTPEQARPLTHLLERSREWLRQSQNADGSWGFYGQPTAEETAYGLLALSAASSRHDERDRKRCAAAADYLSTAADADMPALWIDKCLYTPPLVVRAAIDAALTAWRGVFS
jgi:halimadienyl-diphosphate synthase